MHWYFDVFKKYAVFEGRATRAEYWYFQLFNFAAIMVLGLFAGIVDALAGGSSGVSTTGSDADPILVGIIIVYMLATFLPNLAVSVRRLHDSGKSGLLILVGFIPFIGTILQIIFLVQDSQPGQNEYGPNPKELAAGTASLGNELKSDVVN